MSFLRERIGTYIVEVGTRYDYINGKWLFHGIVRVPTDGSFTLNATDGTNELLSYTLSGHPNLAGSTRAPTDEVVGVPCISTNNMYVNCIGIDGWMTTSDSNTVPDFTITVTPKGFAPFVLTSVAADCMYGSGLDDWTNVQVPFTNIAAQGPIWLFPAIGAWDNGTATPNLHFTGVTSRPGQAQAIYSSLYYTRDVMGLRCTAFDPDHRRSIPMFNTGSPLTYFTGSQPCGSPQGEAPKCSTQRRLTWDFSPADYTVAAATYYTARAKE